MVSSWYTIRRRGKTRFWSTVIEDRSALQPASATDIGALCAKLQALREAGRYAEAEAALGSALTDAPRSVPLFVQAAWVALIGGDFALAEQRGRHLQELAPDRAEGPQVLSSALTQLQRFEEARAVLDRAESSFGDAQWFIAQRAVVALHHGDHAGAVRSAERLRGLFPDDIQGHLVGVAGLRYVNRLPEARELFESSIVRFPGNYWLLLEGARLMQRMGDAAATARTAETLRALAPADPQGYMFGLWALRTDGEMQAAQELARESMSRFPGQPWAIAEEANIAMQCHDVDRALAAATEFRKYFPDRPEGYDVAGFALFALDRVPEAEAIYGEMRARVPGSVQAEIGFARAAELRGAWDEADQRWRDASARHPNDADIAIAIALMPVAQYFQSNRNWPEALRRYAEYEARFPDHPLGRARMSRLLRFDGQFDKAEDIIHRGLERFPSDEQLLLESASIALDRGEYVLAAARFETARREVPHAVLAHCGLATVRSFQGALAEAARIGQDALRRFPGRPEPLQALALIAQRSGDLETARKYMVELGARYPRDETYVHWKRQFDQDHPVTTEGADIHDTHDAETMPPSVLFAQFESLAGTTRGCEFGLVQRSAGIEPLGLLRFARIPYEQLVDGLSCDFNGADFASDLVVERRNFQGGANPEYRVVQQRYQLELHSFQRERDISPEALLSQSRHRLQFLRRKLVEDLHEGRKIFVYGFHAPVLLPEQLARLHDALCRHGKNWLLSVRLADEQNAPGTVRVLRPGLVVGHLAHCSITEQGEPGALDMKYWTEICAATFKLKKLDR